MKIVYCHNYYRHRGGEDISFEYDVEMLRSEGHTVIVFTRDNHQMDGGDLKLARETLWNRRARNEMKSLLARERPDILHCNNLFPQISVSVYSAAKQAGVPVVQALRNYRTFCANSLLYRNGTVCTKCLTSSASWHGLRHACYRESRTATSVIVAMQLFHRLMNMQKRAVDVFATPTQFARQVHIDGGFDPESVMVRSNFVIPDLGRSMEDQGYALFVGRLSDEKGVDTLLKAWSEYSLPIPLRIVGSGPDEPSLQKRVPAGSAVTFLGQLDQADVLEQIAKASFVVMPSRWYETFGRAIAEAFSRGKPVIASRLGAMAELVDDGINGFLFEPTDPASLAAAVMTFLHTSEKAKNRMRHAARAKYEKCFSAQASYQQLLKIYQYAMRTVNGQGHRR